MSDLKIPRELEEVLKNEKLQATVARQPGSRRFKAMVLGVTALHAVKEQEKGERGLDWEK